MKKKTTDKQAGKKTSVSKKSTAEKRNSLSPGTIAIVIVVIFVLGVIVYGATNTTAGGGPSGNNCAENIAYLQAGVDSYKDAFGAFPTSLTQLLETKDGLEPFVETIDLRCPSSGRAYIISNGIVRDS